MKLADKFNALTPPAIDPICRPSFRGDKSLYENAHAHIPMNARDVRIITQDPHFSAEHLHTHRLTHYARRLLRPTLITNTPSRYNIFFRKETTT